MEDIRENVQTSPNKVEGSERIEDFGCKLRECSGHGVHILKAQKTGYHLASKNIPKDYKNIPNSVKQCR
jgi:hypothetical protein